MANSPHRIRRLRWAVTTDTAPTAFALRQQLRDRWADDLLPILEAAFDQTVSGDRVLHIPKLELHIQATADTLWDTLPAQIRQQLEVTLRPPSPSASAEISPPANTPENLDAPHPTPNSPQQTWLEHFCHYILTGSLPWAVVNLPPAAIATELQQVWQQQRSQVWQRLHPSPLDTPAYVRLLQLIPAAERADVIVWGLTTITTPWRDAVTPFLQAWLTCSHPQLSEHLRLLLTAIVLTQVAAQPQSPQPPNLAAITATHLTPSNQAALATILPTLLASLPPEDLPPRALTLSAEIALGNPPEPPPPPSESPPKKPSNPSDPLPHSPTPPLPHSPTWNDTTLPPHLAAYLSPPPPPNPTDTLPLRVTYAGLVLLHGFVPHFFAASDIPLTANNRISPPLLPRAAALLHALATDTPDIYEYELPLIKLLVGLTPSDPLAIAAGLVSAGDRAESHTLITSSISYWPVLQNTSVEALRSAFLQRHGLLYPSEQGWHLRVEGQAFDLLLNHLPWSISLIKLPWMTQPLYTEWPLP